MYLTWLNHLSRHSRQHAVWLLEVQEILHFIAVLRCDKWLWSANTTANHETRQNRKQGTMCRCNGLSLIGWTAPLRFLFLTGMLLSHVLPINPAEEEEEEEESLTWVSATGDSIYMPCTGSTYVLKSISEGFFFFGWVYWQDKWKQHFLPVRKTDIVLVQSAMILFANKYQYFLLRVNVVFFRICCCLLHFRATVELWLK